MGKLVLSAVALATPILNLACVVYLTCMKGYMYDIPQEVT